MIKKIVIANTLKPVDDVRAFEKIAQSIAKTNKYEINIIGNAGKKESGFSSIKFYPHHLSGKSIFKRLAIRYRILGILIKLKPNILIITTHELLTIAWLSKLINRTKIIYDVQEDYKQNIRYLSRLPLTLLLAYLVRLKERISHAYVDQYWLAEVCYENDLQLKPSIVLENKAKNTDLKRNPKKKLSLLFSGTVSSYSQVQLAIEVYQGLRGIKPDTTITIIGQCHDRKLFQWLEQLADQDGHINLQISDRFISHEQITEAIMESDLGIISYQPNAVNENKFPTKLYEYSRYSLPYLIQGNSKWYDKSIHLGGAIAIDFTNPNLDLIIERMKDPTSLFTNNYPETETWESQEGVLNGSIETLIK